MLVQMVAVEDEAMLGLVDLELQDKEIMVVGAGYKAMLMAVEVEEAILPQALTLVLILVETEETVFNGQ